MSLAICTVSRSMCSYLPRIFSSKTLHGWSPQRFAFSLEKMQQVRSIQGSPMLLLPLGAPLAGSSWLGCLLTPGNTFTEATLLHSQSVGKIVWIQVLCYIICSVTASLTKGAANAKNFMDKWITFFKMQLLPLPLFVAFDFFSQATP